MHNSPGQGFGEPIGGWNEKNVSKTPTRGLFADAAAPEAAKTTWFYRFVKDPPDGGFTSNVLAGIVGHILLLIPTILGMCLCNGRARKRERMESYLESQRYNGRALALSKFLEPRVDVLSQGSPGTPPAVHADNSTAQSSSSAPTPPPVPENPAHTAGSTTGGSKPGSPPSSTNAALTEPKKAVQTTKRSSELQQKLINGYTESRSVETHAASMCSESPAVATPCKEHHVIDIPCSFYFPLLTKTKTGDKFKEKAEKEGVTIEQDVFSSRMMQGRVPATEGNLSALRKVAIEGMKLDEGFTLQIGASFMYCCTGNPDEPFLLSLRDVEVPTIFKAEYSAGLLILRGRYLEGAEIRAATDEGYMIFKSVKQDPINSDSHLEERIGTWRCTDLLPPVKLNQIQIFASKTVQIEEQSVTVRSELCSIQDTTLRTVIYKWVPTVIIMSILASQLWVILVLFSDLVTNLLNPWISYSILAWTISIIQLLSPRLEENVSYFIERLKLAISSFHMFPKPLATPPFFMHNGFCFQRGAKYLIYPQPLPPPNFEGDGEPRSTLEVKQSSKQGKGNLVSKIDWKWPCWRLIKKTERYEKFDPDSNDFGSNSDDNLPFEVLYGRRYFLVGNMNANNQYLPKDIVIKLYSRHLQNVVRECSSNKMSQFESYGEIQAQDLFILYISGKLTGGRKYDSWSNLPSTLDGEHEKKDLHMFHLIRFLEKEYGDTINQYGRMMKVGVISWDMLWTLIVPGIDVIYYCKVSNQVLCGKVSTTYYQLEHPLSLKFSVGLEVYDFDCNNFVMANVDRKLFFFKDDVKIINLDVFPLQFKANPQEFEEVLVQRGRTFCDLVLKYEHRFMHYSGLMYETEYEQYEDAPYREKSSHGFKASIDGRVMIDQKWFAKLKSRRKMGTARARGWNPINERLEMRIEAIANKFDHLLKYSPAIAYGYSFSIRKWGCFNITGFSKIHFVSTAFDRLVMKEENKLAVLTLTQYYINNTQGTNNVATHIDILPNKGQGCIIVLHGPPGTGKTLTVESLAEKLECPLWQLSISKLTASTKRLENKMLSTFEVAKSWGAILVLDEADVYLSSRKYSPLSSDNTRNNAMSGVFLRVLEHYKGVLFLTTNVMSRIEPAIFSRISLFVKYEEFNREERKKLWSNFLEESMISHLSEGFWKKVLPAQFNGHVIRNIIQSAQIFIQSRNFETETPEECVLRAFDAMTDPSTMNYLIEAQEVQEAHEAQEVQEAHEANQSIQEFASLRATSHYSRPSREANQYIQEFSPTMGIPSASIDSVSLQAYVTPSIW